MRFNQFCCLFLFTILIFSFSAHAINGRTTYQARIVKPNGYPLESAFVNFRFSVLDPTASCVIYVEDYTGVNMTNSGGLITFPLGTGVVSFPTSATATTFANTFDNSVTSFSCQSPGIYNPTATDNRKVVMQFNDGGGWQTLPAMTINAVPYAMYAAKSQDSQKLNGKTDAAFLQKATDIPTCAAGKMLYFNLATFSCLDLPASNSGVSSVTTSGSVLSLTGTTSAPIISIAAATASQDGYLTSTDWITFNNKQTATSAALIATLGYTPADNATSGTFLFKSNNLSDLTNTSSARINLGLGSLATSNDIDLGSASATGTLAIARLPAFFGDATVAAASNTIIFSNSGVTAGTYAKVTVDVKGRVTSSASLASSDVTTALGYTPVSASAASQWTTNGSTIFYDTGNVGIGTSAPAQRLSVAGMIESTSGGIKFPDGTMQTTASPSSGGVRAALSISGSTDATVANSAFTVSKVSSNSLLSTNPTTSLITVPATGTYLIIVNNVVCQTGANTYISSEILINGVVQTTAVNKAGECGSTTAKASLNLTAGDTIKGGCNAGQAGLTQTCSMDIIAGLPAASTQLWNQNGVAAYYSLGNVGVGTSAPVAKLDVAGEIKLGNSASTCNATNEGQQRYNATIKNMEFCNGTAWTVLGTGLGLGYSQTWQNVTASRAFSTTYTNTTSKPIVVQFGIVNSAAADTTSVQAYVDGIMVVYSGEQSNRRSTFSFIVPAGSTYNATYATTGGAVSIAFWSELR